MRPGRFLCVSVASLALNATWHDVYARTEVAIETSYYEELKAAYDTIYSPVNAYVAEIPMRADVNEYGAVVIDVPLELPDVGGYLQPGLSLRYNSSRPATMFGNEWKLEGFSEIYQVDKSVYYDGVAEPFDEDDAINGSEAFVMDGQRLIMKQNNFPQSVTFQSETGFVRAVARFRSSDDNPSGYEYACFEVSYPDGKTAVFGFKDEESSEDKTYFPITRLTNPVGQSVSYEYEYLNEEYRIRHIRFGKDGEVTVRFDYRPVKAAYRKVIWCTIWGDQTREPTYDGQSTGCALAGISVRYRERPFRDYAFIYRATANYLFLSEIHMVCPRQPSAAANSIGIGGGIGGIDIDVPPIEQYRPGFSVLQNDTAEFAMPLRFCYGDNQSPTYSSVESRSFAEGIVNPCSKKGAFGNDRTSGVVIYPVTAEGGGHIIVRPDLEREDTLQLPAGRGAVEVLCLNMDQTPGDEIVRVNNYISGGADMLEFAVYALDAGNRPQLRQVQAFSTGYPLDNGNCAEKRFFIGDLAGRGSVEVMAVSNLGLGPADSPHIELYDLAKGRTLFSGTVNLRELGFRVSSVTGVTDFIHRRHHWLPGDFDGDGQTEFFFRPNEVTCGAVVKFAVVDGVVEPQSGGMSIELANRNDYTFMVGDFNGDRLSDVYISSDGDVYCSTGKSFYHASWSYTLLTHMSESFCADINGDGCDDVVCGAGTYFFLDGCMVSRMDCEGAASFTRQDYAEPEAGKFELLHVDSDTLTRYTYGIDLSKDLLISGVKSSFGVETRFYYGKLKDTTVYRKTAPPPAFPYQQLYSDATVVRKVRQKAGGKVVSEKDYRYEDAVYHRQGLGFCGFGRVMVTDSIRGQSTSYTFDPVRFNVPLRVESPVQTVSNTYNVSVAADKTAVITLENAVQTDKLKGTSVTTSYLYDNYGQPVQATVDYGNGVKQVTDYRYRNIDTDAQYRLGVLTSQTESLYQGNEYISKGTSFSYNAAGLVENTRSYYDGRLVSEESTPRDGNGWVQSRTVEQYGSGRQLTTTYQYDDWGRVTRETDPTGLSITYSYDADGRLAQTTDARNQVTNYEYDLFGRQVKTRSPQGLVTETEYHWNILEKRTDMVVIGGQEGDDNVPNMPEQARYAVVVHAYGVQERTTPLFGHMADTLQAGTSVVYYDALGREMRTAELRFDGSWLKQDRQYDNRGRLWKESLPYKADAPSWWNVHSYDAYDRPTSIQYASGREDTWTYSGLSVTSRVDGATATKTYDAAGRLTQATDGGGTITYTYRPDGQWQSVSTAGTVTTFAYDEYGRQVSITDPSAGVQQCGYDAAGNLSSQTDAEGLTLTFEYDEYNRLVWRETPEMATAYYYNVYGQPDSIVSDNGTAHFFTYDAYGRVSTERETAPDGKWLEKSASYNPAGGLESVQYSSQSGTIGTELYTYANGYLVELALRKPAVREVWPGGGGIVPVEPQPGIIIGGVQNAPSADAPVIVLPPGSVSGERYNTFSIWELQEEDEQGNPIQVQTDSITRRYGFNDYGFPTHRSACDADGHFINEQSYLFDSPTGHLKRRSLELSLGSESFRYDDMNRLTGYQSSQSQQVVEYQEYAYDNRGNLTLRDDGIPMEYEYEDGGHPYRLTGLSLGNKSLAAKLPDYSVTYTSFKRPATITNNRYVTAFTYNADGERVRRTTTDLTTDSVCTQYYLDGGRYEVGDRGEWVYLGGDPYTAPAVYRKEGNSWTLYHLIRDHQGSILLITDRGGAVQAEYRYDPWGGRLDPATRTYYAPGEEPELMFGRGYTGHEHLPEYGLIHMNARLYDPQTGRFLSPDPYVQDPANTQSYNRYAYALNNPLRYVDPSGERYTYDYGTGLYYDNVFGRFVSWNWVYDWLLGNSKLIDIKGNVLVHMKDVTIDFGNISSVASGPDGVGGLASSGGYGGSGVSHVSVDGWGLSSEDFYEYGYRYYNLRTHQVRYLDAHVYDVGTTLVTQLMDDIADFYGWLDRTGVELSIGGLAYEGLEKLSANKSRWLGKNGKFYSRSWGGNQYTGSRAGALKAARIYSVAGKAVGLLGTGVTIAQWIAGEISGVEASFDLAFSVIGMTGWGTPLSLAYFGGKFLYETISGEDLFDKPY